MNCEHCHKEEKVKPFLALEDDGYMTRFICELCIEINLKLINTLKL